MITITYTNAQYLHVEMESERVRGLVLQMEDVADRVIAKIAPHARSLAKVVFEVMYYCIKLYYILMYYCIK